MAYGPVVRICLVALLAGSGGCANLTATVTIQQALTGVERNLIASKAISISETTLTNPTETAEFDAAVMTAQCSERRADPDVPLLQDSVTMRLSGSFTTGANLSVAGLGGTPVGGITGSLDRERAQEIDVPVTFVILSQLPDVVFQHRLATLAEFPGAQKLNRTDELTTEHDDLLAHVRGLIEGYKAPNCTAAETNGTGTLTMLKQNR